MKTIKDILPTKSNPYIDMYWGMNSAFNRAFYDNRECVIAIKEIDTIKYVLINYSNGYKLYKIINVPSYRYSWIGLELEKELYEKNYFNDFKIVDKQEFKKFEEYKLKLVSKQI